MTGYHNPLKNSMQQLFFQMYRQYWNDVDNGMARDIKIF